MAKLDGPNVIQLGVRGRSSVVAHLPAIEYDAEIQASNGDGGSLSNSSFVLYHTQNNVFITTTLAITKERSGGKVKKEKGKK